MRIPVRHLSALALALVVANAQAHTEQGWWFYQTPPVKPKVKPKPLLPPQAVVATAPTVPTASSAAVTDPCVHKDTWTPNCGFINPGKSFAFQAKERDALMQSMVMNPENPNAVLQFQRYNQWLANEAIQVANMWYFNEIQHPGLNPQSTHPISQFGLQLAEDVKRNTTDQIFKYLAKHAIFLDFTRQSCYYCHAMAPNVMSLSHKTKVPVWDASLSTTGCLPGFQDHCVTAPLTIKPAEILHVKEVPTLFLFIKPDTWIRVGTGVVDEATLRARIVDFVSAYRTAILKGVHNGNGSQASVDFSPGADSSQSLGGDGVGVPSKKGALPTSSDIKALLGQQ
ncbi:hypothetical protein A6M27_16955 [Acidithiobacillus thiooxidans]|uniref:Conjugal transfer protein TraF n=1 Tax=Acidithiobacillus thiooxidans TaxID=930 RepID=A0A1C2I7C6_ACITH|nr:conjugal transfer protein TraF [Acidithiobacillus thiooxidans]OCX69430.1 hypothetical protein A6P07_16575 [Acidithiobacillus thiooxidans]OCX71860.1 hypothetical protein A6O24_14830 [Acidithiobacillus thiooxidans]OCX81055.1 hypothetical protein A6O26_13765 [Acidithiobacillus thiooxidans]OCX83783.1 hypothetical protein A6M27_16955 [Acidithiobacillus thiooxidans]OFC50269.1 hypothetical protein BAE47_02940 [Acidithiobacillus thiooxidans]